MAYTEFTKDMQIIQKLNDRPNALGTPPLAASELKEKFDEGGEAIKAYINNTLLPELNNTAGDLATDEAAIDQNATDIVALKAKKRFLYADDSISYANTTSTTILKAKVHPDGEVGDYIIGKNGGVAKIIASMDSARWIISTQQMQLKPTGYTAAEVGYDSDSEVYGEDPPTDAEEALQGLEAYAEGLDAKIFALGAIANLLYYNGAIDTTKTVLQGQTGDPDDFFPYQAARQLDCFVDKDGNIGRITGVTDNEVAFVNMGMHIKPTGYNAQDISYSSVSTIYPSSPANVMGALQGLEGAAETLTDDVGDLKAAASFVYFEGVISTTSTSTSQYSTTSHFYPNVKADCYFVDSKGVVGRVLGVSGTDVIFVYSGMRVVPNDPSFSSVTVQDSSGGVTLEGSYIGTEPVLGLSETGDDDLPVRVMNVATPTLGTDAANKAYVDAQSVSVTPVAVVTATGAMTSEQKAQTRENIGAGVPLTSQQIADGAGAWLEDNLATPSTPPIDSSLSVANAAADAKTTGDKIGELNSALSVAVDSSPSSWESVELTLQNGYYYKGTSTFYSASDKRTAKLAVSVGDKYKLSTYTRSAVIPGIVFFNSNNVEVSTLLDGTGTGQVITDYEFTVPSGIASMAVQSGDAAQAIPVLSKYESGTATFKAYTKSEADARFEPIKKYGLKWEIANADDLGSRCFDAVGLTASIGIGSGSGQSDFDNIYPWSEMKRCNIKQNANGAKIVTFEGETGFALDGSNGDVFVRIPKFYYEHYSDSGFEYVIISSEGDKLHPAFVENGMVLDEIFVGAFEGHISNNKLHSVGNVIPTSNETGVTFLSAATANGTGYTLYDMRTSDALWALMAVEFGCRNSNRIIGYGYADFLQAVNGQWGVVSDSSATQTNVFSVAKSVPQARLDYMPVGSNIVICKGTMYNCIAFAKLIERTSDSDHWYLRFDGDPVNLDTTCFVGSAACTTNFCETAPAGAMTYHTGRTNWINNSNTKNPIRYRWIENAVGSLWSIFPDITFNDLQMYQCSDITKYNVGAIDNGYVPIGDLLPQQESNGNKADVTGSNFWITKMFNPYFGKGITFGKEWDTSLTSDKAFGAYYYLMTGRKIVANGGGFDHLFRCNMLTNRAWLATSDAWYLYGSRLIYKNI